MKMIMVVYFLCTTSLCPWCDIMNTVNYKTVEHLPVFTNDSLHVVPEETREFFYWLILIIAVSAVIGNALAIRSIIKRKTKFLQKCCIVSLALADILTAVLYAINHLDTLSNELKIWTLGEFMCYLIPMGQNLGTTTSSIMLLVISLDRYQNVCLPSQRWNPRPIICIILMFSLLVVCTVLSFPMAINFNYEPMLILFVGPYSQKPLYQLAYTCITSKQRILVYYVSITTLVFLPVLTIFTCFYFKIAVLIWKHRKPITLRSKESENKLDTEDPSFSTTKSTALSNVSRSPGPRLKKTRSIHVERKIRTFRIVLVLMISFAVCRLPYCIYYIIRLVGTETSKASWNINFALVALNLLSCALNPLLYPFQNETINAIKVISDFVFKVCCCCFSNDEFEEFEKEDSFLRERHAPVKIPSNRTVAFTGVHIYQKHVKQCTKARY
ncbi:probable G-protein coupled receptor No18 [Leptinotarsa decemlineata]|uniref:probable G-protein coupled receptor No18 n=1 Tax=Leptinotarsa decemlineata TaxID=7539 RepID=UPI003D309A61